MPQCIPPIRQRLQTKLGHVNIDMVEFESFLKDVTVHCFILNQTAYQQPPENVKHLLNEVKTRYPEVAKHDDILKDVQLYAYAFFNKYRHRPSIKKKLGVANHKSSPHQLSSGQIMTTTRRLRPRTYIQEHPSTYMTRPSTRSRPIEKDRSSSVDDPSYSPTPTISSGYEKSEDDDEEPIQKETTYIADDANIATATTVAPSTSPVVHPRHDTIRAFLAGCGPGLLHHLDSFIAFGITNQEWLRAIAAWPVREVEVTLLRMPGMTFVEMVQLKQSLRALQ